MRALPLLLLTGLASASPRVGAWGEDPSVVPPFSLKEERRAPKCPDAPALWKEFQTARERDAVEGGLLVCNLQVGQPVDKVGHAILDVFTLGAAELLNANVTLKLKLRNDPTIVLWAPFKHNASFVSIPAVKLSRGDAIDLALVDRKLFSNESLGHARASWDGRSPLELSTTKWSARCTLLDADEALAHARAWIESVDRQLEKISAAHADRALPDLGRPKEIAQLQGLFRDDEREGNFRYAAGFVGWAHPEIASRLARLKSGEAAFEKDLARELAVIASDAARGPVTLGETTYHFSQSSLRVDAPGELECGALQKSLAEISLVDESGRFHQPQVTLRDAAGHPCDKDGPLKPPVRGTLRRTVQQHGRIRFVRLADGRFVRVD